MTDAPDDEAAEKTHLDHLRLAEITEDIQAAHRNYQKNAELAAEYVIRQGELLTEAKVLLGHGRFGRFVREQCPFAERTAQLYMQVYAARVKPATIAEMGLVHAAAAAVSPPPRAHSTRTPPTVPTSPLNPHPLPRRFGSARLWRGDCAEILHLITEPFALVTDPPYGIDFKGKAGDDGRKPYKDDACHWLKDVLPRLRRYIERAERGGVFVAERWFQQFPPHDGFGGIYNPAGNGQGRWGFTTFHPVLFYGKAPTHAFQSRSGVDISKVEPRDPANPHPCPKPLEYCKWLVERVSEPGGLVVDPFAGTFTIGLACLMLGRRYIGIEADPDFYNYGCERIRETVALRQKTEWLDSQAA